jgi:hypothetical protein
MDLPPEMIRAFRDGMRQNIVERLALQTALAVRMSVLGLSAQESCENLKGWLDHNSAVADQAYGSHFRDPALSALYADEVREIVDEMKAEVDKMGDDAKRIFGPTK